MEAEICVIGGGPAGAVAAYRLAQQGHDVLLLEGCAFPRRHVGESLPPSVLPMLEWLGLRERVEHSGVVRPRGACIRWGRHALWYKEFPTTPGMQVDRGRFDALLLEAARQAGVRVLQPARASRPRHVGPHAWRVPTLVRGSTRTVTARFLIDASGRRGITGGRVIRLSAPTIALFAYWHEIPLRRPDPCVEAAADQWYWGAPLPDGVFNATVFVDAERCKGYGTRGLGALYNTLVGQSVLLSPCLQGTLVSPIRACDASVLAREAPIGDDWIALGEASFALDPLSSQGVNMAITTGLQGSIVVHTMLTLPANATLAQAFYQARCTESLTTHRRFVQQYYAEQAACTPTAFWLKRCEAPLPTPSVALRSFTPGPLALDQPLRLSSLCTLQETPVIADEFVIAQFALDHPAFDRPIAFVHGLSVAHLASMLNARPTGHDLLTFWACHTSYDHGYRLLSWLWNAGVITYEQVGQG